jgi:hypothetical protein
MAYNIKKGETNTTLVEKFMEMGSPLNQAFLIDAVSKQAQLVVNNKEELLKQPDQFVSMKAWVKCAEDWLKCQEDRR